MASGGSEVRDRLFSRSQHRPTCAERLVAFVNMLGGNLKDNGVKRNEQMLIGARQGASTGITH